MLSKLQIALFLLSILYTSVGFGQQIRIDSLQGVLATQTLDEKKKCDLLYTIADNYTGSL